MFLDKNSKKKKKNHFTMVGPIENKVQKQKRKMVSEKTWSIRTKYFNLK